MYYRRIRDASEDGGYPPTDWQHLGLVLRAVLHPHPDVATRTPAPNDTVNDTVRDTVNERQQWFLEQLVGGRRVAAPDLMERFGVSLSKARRDLRGLAKEGLICFVGPPKTGHYQLMEA